jgi:hypothetical protein
MIVMTWISRECVDTPSSASEALVGQQCSVDDCWVLRLCAVDGRASNVCHGEQRVRPDLHTGKQEGCITVCSGTVATYSDRTSIVQGH